MTIGELGLTIVNVGQCILLAVILWELRARKSCPERFDLATRELIKAARFAIVVFAIIAFAVGLFIGWIAL